MTRASGETETRGRAAASADGHADGRALTAVDKITLGYQRAYPRTRLAVGNLLVGHGPAPDIQELRDLVADRARAFPPLTHRVAPAGWGRLVWTADTAFDPARHVQECRVPAGSGLAGLREAIERLSTIEISMDAPPWQLWLLHGDRPDGFAVLFRGSHARMDGAALDLVLGKLFGPPGQEARREPPRPLPDRRRHSLLAVGRAAAHSLGWLASTTAIGPLAAAPTGRTRHAWLEIDLARLRAIGRAYGATVNDIFLAALAGALRAWCPPETGRPRRAAGGRGAIHAAMPVSTRLAPQRDVVSNYLTTVRIALPYGEASMRGRVDAIRRQTIRLKRHGAPGVAERLFLWTVPAPLRTAALSTGIATRGFALTASNPAGLTGPFEILGRPVVDAVPVPPVPAGQRLAVLLSGLDRQVRVGFSTDASVPGHTRLADLFAAELDALEAAGGIRPNPSDGAVAGPVSSLAGPTRPATPHSFDPPAMDSGPRPADPSTAGPGPSGRPDSDERAVQR
ncbi:wax ester/triacylglycerol synthase domain-containing protein [Pseudofrankia sp. BMG5.37]|uniref:wax ester/triacylglycerol synthase domain-containing protein n=1 Tax=Pseudofrankia sp. BMG5.37 TaxID=3050035 RepID=UPI002894B4D7|nr:wax ester/triacylglycerol synthase domain-containing protein [Pseudofrankia sp. BMG5.37]MDT3441051.1 wax ester/triacylglycerol synthase family O-acyltransferase [Pseudofrankia sp. BMG5.37]